MRHLLLPLALVLCVPCASPDVAEEGDGIVASMALAPGMTVADVGAGDGKYSVVLARGVGPAGRVYATEVDAAEIDKIAARVDGEGLRNVKTVVGSQDDTGLPASCCDAILLRMVYHHFTDTAAMRRSLWNALKPGGRLVIIDVPPKKGWRHLDGVPERGGHGISMVELTGDMSRSGFEVVSRKYRWPAEEEAYLVVFRRPGG